MKKLLSIILFMMLLCTSGLFAQNKLTVVGGLNFSTIKYNDNDFEKIIDVSPKAGFMIGIETETGPLKVGCAFVQRGAELAEDSYYGDGTSSATFNYIDVYALFPVSLNKQLSAFGGLELGKCLGGEEKVKDSGNSGTLTFDAEDFNTEIGVIFGIDYM
jgi:Outer membrane protein beta-barrel domain